VSGDVLDTKQRGAAICPGGQHHMRFVSPLRLYSLLKAARSWGALVLVSLTPASFLAAATYYVAPNGSDSNNGSSASPFKTIQKAADVASPGDTVILRNGTYTGDSSAVADIHRSGTSGQWITFKAENLWGAILDGRNFSTGSGLNIESGVGYVRIEGLQIQNTIVGGISANENTHDLYYYRNLIHHVGRICTDTSGGQVGFRDKRTSSRMTYDSNVMHTIGRLHPSDGCSYSTGNYKNHDHGVYLHGTSIKIINNVFYNFRSGWAIQSSEGASDWVIANNTFAFANPNRQGQIVLWDGNTNFVIANNIFYQPDGAAIFLDPCSGKSNIAVRNNVSTADMLFDDASGRNTCSGITLLNNKTFTDPKLADPAKLNFRLTSSSPAINQADASVSPSVDHEGTARPQGGGFDSGAFEFGGQGTSNDTAAPLVAFSTPAAGSKVKGIVTVLATASDNVGVVGVQFQLDGVNLGSEDTSNNYSIPWDTKAASDGLHVLSAIARDAAGNVGTSALTVTVDQQGPAPPTSLQVNVPASSALSIASH
jgi:Bacterial Ig domain/Pel9A-like, right handed beta helix region/Right handed beta helix region